MRYEVSERFYNTASALIALALDDENTTEYDLALDLIRDLVVKE